MIGRRLRVHGRYVEAYLYFDFLWLFANDGSVRAFDIAAFCSERLNGDGDAAAALFSDNRVLDNPYAIETNDKAKKLLSLGGFYDVSPADVDEFSYIFDAKLNFRSILDVKFYYGRAYLGTDGSIFQILARDRATLRDQKRGSSLRGGLGEQPVSDLPARAFHCRFGAIGAACGRAGGLVGFGANSSDDDWRIQFKKFSESSYGLALNGRAVTNLAKPNHIQFFKATLQDRAEVSSGNFEEKNEDIQKSLVNVLGETSQSQSDEINNLTELNDTQGVFLFNSTLWRFDEDGHQISIQLLNSNLEIGQLNFRSKRLGPPGRVLSLSSVDAGVIAESDNAVFLYASGKWAPLVDEAVHSVRGYQNSKRYKRAATVVARDRVEIITI